MIAFIEGTILFLDTNSAVVMCNGIGYQVLLSRKEQESLLAGQKHSLHIYTHVREDAIELFGFNKLHYKQVFQILISVSGVGPRLALSILSTLSAEEIVDAIINKNIGVLASVSGIGKKTAERLSLELKDKAQKLEMPISSNAKDHGRLTSLAQAIRALGYSKAQSDRALARIAEEDVGDVPLEELIKKTLAVLTRT